MSTFVLLHGSWHGSWAWNGLEQKMHDLEHQVYSPTLQGCAELFDAHASGQVTLETHIDQIAALLRLNELQDVVLVGHSSAGMLLDGIANREGSRISSLVFLDSYVIEYGKSAFDVWTSLQVEEAESSIRAGFPYRNPLPAEALGLSGQDASDAEYKFTPHPLGCFNHPIPAPNPGARVIPRHFIQCSTGPLVDIFQPHADEASRRGWSMSVLEAPHDCMLTHPAELATALDRLSH